MGDNIGCGPGTSPMVEYDAERQRISGGPDNPDDHLKEIRVRLDDYRTEHERVTERKSQLEALIMSHEMALAHYEGPSQATPTGVR